MNRTQFTAFDDRGYRHIDNHSHLHLGLTPVLKVTSDTNGLGTKMYVCICNAISERQVREVVDRGAHSLSEVQAHLPIASCCGTCSESAAEIVDEHVQQKMRGCCRSAA